MRKIFPIFFLIFVMSCGKLPSDGNTVPESVKLTSDKIIALTAMKERHTVRYDAAEELAVEAPGLFDEDTKSEVKRIAQGIAITRDMAGLTKSGSYIGDTLMYIFNYADNEGYVFVSADERAPGILAYIEDGNFNPADSIECPGTGMLFSGIEVMQRL